MTTIDPEKTKKILQEINRSLLLSEVLEFSKKGDSKGALQALEKGYNDFLRENPGESWSNYQNAFLLDMVKFKNFYQKVLESDNPELSEVQEIILFNLDKLK